MWKEIKILSAAALFITLTLTASPMVAAAYYLIQDDIVYNQPTVTNQEQERDEVTKTAKWYMYVNERLFEELAFIEARATIAAAEKYKVPYELLVAVISAESEGHPFARSRTGAAGLGQVDFEAHKERFPDIKSERDKYDPVKNVNAAAELLAEYLHKYGKRRALQVYNLGESAFQKGQRADRYADRVIKTARQYRKFNS